MTRSLPYLQPEIPPHRMALAKENTGKLRGRAKFGVNLKDLRVLLLVLLAFSLDLSIGKVMGQSREVAVDANPLSDNKKVDLTELLQKVDRPRRFP
jgi:hypothetical protein